MDKYQLNDLIDKVSQGKASPEELKIYNAYLNQAIQKNNPVNYILTEEEEELKAELMNRIVSEIGIKEKPRRIVNWPKIAVAASVVIALTTGGHWLVSNKKHAGALIYQAKTNDILPGRNQATLTLSNGKKIILTKGLTGKLAQLGNSQVNVNGANEIVYSGSGSGTDVNTLSTSAGEQSPYPLVLADGTKVWLNSNSSVTFPTGFNGKTREVKITGEAYFDVIHNSSQPFRVTAGNQTVEDIGTAFDINSYTDEAAIRTTLVHGAAKVIANGKSKILKPGYRTRVNQNSIVLESADTEAETAWITGSFVFHEEDLRSVMREIARWYDIKVVYDYDAKNVILGGGFSKSVNISRVLSAFEQTGAVKFKIEGRTVHVIK